MNWIKNFVRPKIRNILGVKRETPENMWVKCPETGEMVFYRDLEGDDLDKVMAHFDQTVEYYSSGPKERAFIANELGQYCAYYPVRSLSIAAVKLKPSPKPDRVTVNFDLRSFLRNPDQDATMSGRAHVEWDLIKRDGALKITRFAGTAVTEPAPSASP